MAGDCCEMGPHAWPRTIGAPKISTSFTDRRAARACIERILAWPAEKVLMAHGTPVTSDGQAFLRRAFRWLIV